MKFQKISPIFIFFILSIANASFAQTEMISPEALTLKSSPIITVSYLFQLFISLLIVFGLMYMVTKYVIPKIKVTTQSKHIQVIDKVGLEPQVAAYILKVKDSSWLVVVSNKNASVVSKLEAL
ncbi:hypothetical protein ACFLZ2_03040 [Candidatus Margulisiibacteriota bacterium]